MDDSFPAHFYLAPSSANRWLNCPGSLRICADITDETSEAAEIGTMCHSFVEAELRGEEPSEADLQLYESLSPDHREWVKEAVNLCVDTVSELEGDLLTETKIQHHFLEEHGGTVDVIIHNVDCLHVVDFKFGRVHVEVQGNAQIKCYLNLARQLYPEATKFFGSILQPSVSDKLQTVEFSLDELEYHEIAVVSASVSDTVEAGDHCKWCPALPMCKVAAKYLHDQVREFPDLTQLASEVETTPTAEQVGEVARMYKVCKLAEQACDGAGKILKRWASGGGDLKEYDLGLQTRSRAYWVDGAEEILKEKIGDCYKEPQLITPAEARKAMGLKKKDFEDQLQDVLTFKQTQALVVGRDVNPCSEFDEL